MAKRHFAEMADKSDRVWSVRFRSFGEDLPQVLQSIGRQPTMLEIRYFAQKLDLIKGRMSFQLVLGERILKVTDTDLFDQNFHIVLSLVVLRRRCTSSVRMFCWYRFSYIKKDGSVGTWRRNKYGNGVDVEYDLTEKLSRNMSYHSHPIVSIFSSSDAIAVLQTNGQLLIIPDSGKDAMIYRDVVDVCATEFAFAILKSDASVETYGGKEFGGDSSRVSKHLVNVEKIVSTCAAFAAVRFDGSVVSWGEALWGGISREEMGSLLADPSRKFFNNGMVHTSSNMQRPVMEIYSTERAFAARKDDGSVVTWGWVSAGGDSSEVSEQLHSGVVDITANQCAFAAVKSDGSVVTWGDVEFRGDCSLVNSESKGDVDILFPSARSFIALKKEGRVVDLGYIPDHDSVPFSSVESKLGMDVVDVVSGPECNACAAILKNGSVVTWGSRAQGGDSSGVAELLSSGVTSVVSNGYAFAALKNDGSVVSWGNLDLGGCSSSVEHDLKNVVNVIGKAGLFIALTSDERMVIWGKCTIVINDVVNVF